VTVKVLSMTGWCRNGSTILGNVLGEVPGVVHVGELHFLWRNGAGLGVNRRCGCGRELTDCPRWAPILAAGVPAGTSPVEHAREVVRRQRSAVRTRHTWLVLRDGTRRPDARAHADLMAATFAAIAECSGAALIVDTTKIPGESALLPHVDGVDPYFVHLVRDPVATAYSWRAPKDYVYALPAWKSTAYWVGFNLAARALLRRHPERSMLLRYEDFTADPAGTVDALLALCGLSGAPNPVRGRVVDLHTNHTVTGNPDRFRTGETVIRDRDDAWRTGLPAAARATAMALSFPQRLRYGYRYTRPAGPPPVGARTEEDTVGSGA
jgi:hypothetical protein